MRIRPPKSSIPPLKNSIPELNRGEQIVLQGQCGYRENHCPGWKLAKCFLTTQRLIIYHRPMIRFEVALGDIQNLEVEKAYYVLR
jgi:hypothetical protein